MATNVRLQKVSSPLDKNHINEIGGVIIELQDIIDSVDIVEYISQFVDLEEQNGEMFGLSPFKEESTASFSITPSNQLFFDFSAGFGGNILTFIQKYNKCSFSRAVEILKEYANISDDYVDRRLSATKEIRKFKKTARKKKEVAKHKILSPDVMSKYENDKSKLQIWEDEGLSYDVMEKYNVRYDPFSNRIVYPIRDMSGNIISVKGRTLDPDFKKKKLRKYTYFQEIGDIDLIFGYVEHQQSIKNANEIILFEGEKSVLHAETWGIENTGSILTSHLNPLQLPILIKLGVSVVFALDKDVDIRKDANIKKLSHFVKVEYIKDTENLIGEKDAPVDAGKDVWERLYERRKHYN